MKALLSFAFQVLCRKMKSMEIFYSRLILYFRSAIRVRWQEASRLAFIGI